jgi:hypothetical protein
MSAFLLRLETAKAPIVCPEPNGDLPCLLPGRLHALSAVEYLTQFLTKASWLGEIATFLTNALISSIIHEKDTKKICHQDSQGVIVGLQLRAWGPIA